MAYRPTWQGHLRLSLVTCPVALYTATSSGGEVHFNLINPETNNRIKMVTTDPDTGPIERSKLVKGYEVSKGEYILLTQDEINDVKLESTKTIDIERFVPAEDIDRRYWDNPYYLAPDGKLAQEAFAVIRESMARSGQIALGRVVMSTRERLLALEPSGKGILAYTLRTDAEVRDEKEVFGSISDKDADPQMIAIAQKIIEQKEGPFDPSQFVDRYEEALKDLIKAKQKGHKVAKVEEPEDTNVIDLMAALRASLGGDGAPKSGGEKASTAQASSKAAGKTAAKAKTPAKAKAKPKASTGQGRTRKAG
ncbi:Ku protein [Caulobacter flavus]|uniref:Non-homologous end joining protein Ku n=1 Tax=Caulobacter flavus TaxID=1679497 RepID=A0A2N5CP55_9CAUL|nr:Ku protein [Caulobacter flavus]AYV48567.1 Ku protein [Caulobacter flavus]PLR08716.1 Ku protein [Caulobacter flavus]